MITGALSISRTHLIWTCYRKRLYAQSIETKLFSQEMENRWYANVMENRLNTHVMGTA